MAEQYRGGSRQPRSSTLATTGGQERRFGATNGMGAMMRLNRSAWRMARLAVVAAILVTGCASTGPFVWVTDLPPEEVSPSDYLIADGDVVSVRVFNQDPNSTRAKVRSDGKIAVPFIGDIQMQGRAPNAVAKEVEGLLQKYINAPNVTVVVEEFQPLSISVIGEVSHPGTFALERNSGVLQAIAAAGGLTDYASRDSVYVLRSSPVGRRIRFRYEFLTRSPPEGSSTFLLRPRDIVVVE